MRCQEIVNVLKENISKYTTDFTDELNIESLVVSGDDILATTSNSHNFSIGDYVTITGAKSTVNITEIIYQTGILTITTASDHQQIPPENYGIYQPFMLQIVNCDNQQFNGIFELLAVENKTNLKLKCNFIPILSSATSGKLLVTDYENFNGYKRITEVIDASTFKYKANDFTKSNQAYGLEIKAIFTSRIQGFATASRIIDFLSEKADSYKPWLLVLVDGRNASYDGITAEDIDISQIDGASYIYNLYQEFTIFAFVPCKQTTTGVDEADKARNYIAPILKTIGRYKFDINLSSEKYQGATFLGDEADNYDKQGYIHMFRFASRGIIYDIDVYNDPIGVPLQSVTVRNDKGYDVINATMR